MKASLRQSLYFAFSIFIFLCLWVSDSTKAQSNAEATTEKHLGTWKLVSTKYGNDKEFTRYPESSSRLKLITSTHFTWLEVNSATKKVLASAGGRYTLSGNIYTETIDFAGEGMDAYLGKAQKFTIKVDGDKLFQAGDLSDGLHIEENWERVK
jgi:hypothetical protein